MKELIELEAAAAALCGLCRDGNPVYWVVEAGCHKHKVSGGIPWITCRAYSIRALPSVTCVGKDEAGTLVAKWIEDWQLGLTLTVVDELVNRIAALPARTEGDTEYWRTLTQEANAKNEAKRKAE